MVLEIGVGLCVCLYVRVFVCVCVCMCVYKINQQKPTIQLYHDINTAYLV